MQEDISKQINEVEPDRWTEIMSKATEYFDRAKTYSIDLNKFGESGHSVRVTAPSMKEVKELALFALEVEKLPDEPPKKRTENAS